MFDEIKLQYIVENQKKIIKILKNIQNIWCFNIEIIMQIWYYIFNCGNMCFCDFFL